MQKEKVSNRCGWKDDEESRRSVGEGEYRGSVVDGC